MRVDREYNSNQAAILNRATPIGDWSSCLERVLPGCKMCHTNCATLLMVYSMRFL